MENAVKVHLTLKNFLAIIIGVCVVGLAVIPLKVSPDHLGWHRWQFGIYFLSIVGIGAIFLQALLQSVEDHNRISMDAKRDASMEEMRQLLGKIAENAGPVAISSDPPTDLANTNSDTEFDGELQRIFSYPRLSIDFRLYRDVWKAAGHQGEPKVDVDILVLMYVVNTSGSTHYVRDLIGSVEVDGVRNKMIRQDDFKAPVFNQTVEYGWEVEQDTMGEPDALKPLFAHLPDQLEPRAPAEGWVRFLLPAADYDKINSNTWQFSILDSVGKEHLITKVKEVKKKGEIALRRASQVS
jgi:hypothetical protein